MEYLKRFRLWKHIRNQNDNHEGIRKWILRTELYSHAYIQTILCIFKRQSSPLHLVTHTHTHTHTHTRVHAQMTKIKKSFSFISVYASQSNAIADTANSRLYSPWHFIGIFIMYYIEKTFQTMITPGKWGEGRWALWGRGHHEQMLGPDKSWQHRNTQVDWTRRRESEQKPVWVY